MAYDFVLTSDWAKWIECIQFGKEERALEQLAQFESKFIKKIQTYYYANAVYGVEEMANYRKELTALFGENLSDDERALLYKFIAILTYGIENNESITGLGD